MQLFHDYATTGPPNFFVDALLSSRTMSFMDRQNRSRSIIAYHFWLCVIMLERLQTESTEVNQAHQSSQLDRFAAYKTVGSKLEDVTSSSSGIHEPIDSISFRVV
ncbi:hypothetical protein Bca52824_028613 [Brassica carinata]|uniref:Uncharacterized protein n=1 Tax=Brassica carinata TaxID=52824 RepID=A0A8X7VD76_BRACI|nr:hypothetical protein Bca52824_028613 [Brassica carinata]